MNRVAHAEIRYDPPTERYGVICFMENGAVIPCGHCPTTRAAHSSLRAALRKHGTVDEYVFTGVFNYRGLYIHPHKGIR